MTLPRHELSEDALPAQLDEIADTLDQVLVVLDQEEGLEVVLDRLARTALLVLAGADAVSVTLTDDTGPRTAAWTSAEVLPLDEVQHSAGAGPCMATAWTQEPTRASVTEVAGTWPAFAEAARVAGVLSYLSAPLAFPATDDRDEELVGSLNAYSCTDNAFHAIDTAVVNLLTATTTAAIGNARRYLRSRELIAHLTRALTSRSTIDQAKGALMARHGWTADQAFAELVRRSQHENVKLADVAREYLAALTPSQ